MTDEATYLSYAVIPALKKIIMLLDRGRHLLLFLVEQGHEVLSSTFDICKG